MKKFSPAFLALAILALVMSPAVSRADTFDFSFGGLAFSGSGTFTGNQVSPGTYLITQATGNVTDIFGTSAIDSNVLGVNTFKSNDNDLYDPGIGFLGSKSFDSKGISFGLANGNDVNLEDGYFLDYAIGGPSNGKLDVTEFVLEDVSQVAGTSPVPEPSSLFLFGTGIIGIAGAAKRKFLSTQTV